MKKIIVLLSLILSSCGSSDPKTLYVSDLTNLTDFEKTQINSALDLLAEGAGERFLSSSGNRPLYVKQAQLNGTETGYARPRTFQCEIGIDSESDLIRSQPELIQYVFIHQLGHCYGLPYSSDPNSVMYPTFSGTWDNATRDKLKNFAKTLRDLSR